jgi:hypothetical protein
MGSPSWSWAAMRKVPLPSREIETAGGHAANEALDVTRADEIGTTVRLATERPHFALPPERNRRAANT